MFYLIIVNKILHHCHSWLAQQYLNESKCQHDEDFTEGRG